MELTAVGCYQRLRPPRLVIHVAAPPVGSDDVQVMHPISEILQPILGHPSWLVQCGYGSFITMEFGAPEVTVGQPIRMPVAIEGAPAKTPRRLANVTGEWHLWIYCCHWSLRLDDVQVAHNESNPVTMNRALGVLNGQILQSVDIEPVDGRTRFTFDLGCSLVTYPAPSGSYSDEPVEQWKLHPRTGSYLTIRADGAYWLGDRHQKPDDMHWEPMTEPVAVTCTARKYGNGTP